MTYDVEYTREIKIASGLVKLVTEKYRINDTTSPIYAWWQNAKAVFPLEIILKQNWMIQNMK